VGGINCAIDDHNVASGTCSATFVYGTVVSLTATPGADALFNGWGMDCSGFDATNCHVTVTGNKHVTSGFEQGIPLHVAVSGQRIERSAFPVGTIIDQWGGVVTITSTTPAWAGLFSYTCGVQTGSVIAIQGTMGPSSVACDFSVLRLDYGASAAPGPGAVRHDWTGDCAGAAGCALSLTGPRSIGMTFSKP
jgi:hypothetical protein